MKKSVSPKKLVRFTLTLLTTTGLMLQASGQTSYSVGVTSNVFTPDEITISPGDTVIWTNTQGNHNVNGTRATFPENPESFGNEVGAGWTFSHVFTIPGTYDYRCDPHYGWGMTGKVIVEDNSSSAITINLSGMEPHEGEEIFFALIDAETGERIDSTSRVVVASFSVVLSGIVTGRTYHVDFFADHNRNGQYDPPPADHAWRLEVPDVTGGKTLYFEHNGNFTDIYAVTGLGLSVDELETEIYPNPATGYINIGSAGEIGSVQLISTTGVALRYMSNLNFRQVRLSLDGIPAGLYILEVKGTDQRRAMSRIVIQ